jgi:hypothetical protein
VPANVNVRTGLRGSHVKFPFVRDA